MVITLGSLISLPSILHIPVIGGGNDVWLESVRFKKKMLNSSIAYTSSEVDKVITSLKKCMYVCRWGKRVKNQVKIAFQYNFACMPIIILY